MLDKNTYYWTAILVGIMVNIENMEKLLPAEILQRNLYL